MYSSCSFLLVTPMAAAMSLYTIGASHVGALCVPRLLGKNNTHLEQSACNTTYQEDLERSSHRAQFGVAEKKEGSFFFFFFFFAKTQIVFLLHIALQWIDLLGERSPSTQILIGVQRAHDRLGHDERKPDRQRCEAVGTLGRRINY